MKNEFKLELPGRRTTRRQLVAGALSAFGGFALASSVARAETGEEISHTSEAIHQEPVFKASRQRVYKALTDAKQFDRVVQLGAATKSGMVSAAKPTEMSPEVGGAFSLSADSSSDAKWNLCLTNESSKLGARPEIGSRASIRLRGLNWLSKAPKPKLFSITEAFQMVIGNTLPPDGR